MSKIYLNCPALRKYTRPNLRPRPSGRRQSRCLQPCPPLTACPTRDRAGAGRAAAAGQQQEEEEEEEKTGRPAAAPRAPAWGWCSGSGGRPRGCCGCPASVRQDICCWWLLMPWHDWLGVIMQAASTWDTVCWDLRCCMLGLVTAVYILHI